MTDWNFFNESVPYVVQTNVTNGIYKKSKFCSRCVQFKLVLHPPTPTGIFINMSGSYRQIRISYSRMHRIWCNKILSSLGTVSLLLHDIEASINFSIKINDRRVRRPGGEAYLQTTCTNILIRKGWFFCVLSVVSCVATRCAEHTYAVSVIDGFHCDVSSPLWDMSALKCIMFMRFEELQQPP